MWACERISRASERGGYFERIVKLSEQSSSARRAGHGLSACLARNWVQHNWAPSDLRGPNRNSCSARGHL